MRHSSKKLAKSGIIRSVSDTTIYFDYICESSLKESEYKEHITELKHRTALSAVKKEFTIHGVTLTCRVCKFEGDWQDAISHRKKYHGSPIIQHPVDMYARFVMNTITKEKRRYYCHLCSYKTSNCMTTLNHIETSSHQEMKAKHYLPDSLLVGDLLKEYDYMRIVYSSIYIGYNGFFICNTCKSHLHDIKSCLQHLDSYSNGVIKNVKLNCLKIDDSTTDDKVSNKLHNTNGDSNIISCLVSQCTQKTNMSTKISQRHGNALKSLPECIEADVSAVALVKTLIPLLPQKCVKNINIGHLYDIDDRFNQKFLKYHAEEINTIDRIETQKIKLSTQRSIRKKSFYIYCLLCDETMKDDIHSYYQHLHTSYHNSNLTSIEDINDKCSQCMENKKKHKANEKMQENINLIEEFIVSHGTEQVNCLICNRYLFPNKIPIFKHVLSQQHKRNHHYASAASEELLKNILSLSLDWYNTFKYYSCFDDRTFKSDIDFKAVINSTTSELKDLSEVCNLHGEENQFMSCIYCATVWYGSPSTCIEHFTNKMHKYMMKNRDFLKLELPGRANFLLKSFEQKASDLVLDADLVQSKEEDKEQLVKCLEDTVKIKYPNVKAHVFGSRISGIGFLDSDIDIFLDCDGHTYNKINTWQKFHFFNVEMCIRNKPEYWEVEEVLPNSRVPIIKLCHRDTEIKCDVSFSNGLNVEKAKLLRCFNNKYPLCRKIILFLKKWLSFCGLSGPRNISNYALALCVIFYLQKEHKILPSIASLIKKKNQSQIVAGWETVVSYDFTINNSNATFKDLLIGFFDYYAKFNYMHEVICPLLADIVLKRSFAHWTSLSDKMSIYVRRLELNTKPEYFRIDSCMCVQDPFDLSDNITRAVQKLTLNRFRKYCEQSANFLRNI